MHPIPFPSLPAGRAAEPAATRRFDRRHALLSSLGVAAAAKLGLIAKLGLLKLLLLSPLAVDLAPQAGDASPAVEGTAARITLAGAVPAACALEVLQSVRDLNLVDGETRRQVGTIAESCNLPGGYRVTLTSAHGGQLVPEQQAGPGVPYLIEYDGQRFDLAQPATLVRDGAGFTAPKPVGITLPPQERLTAGRYVDEIQLSIVSR